MSEQTSRNDATSSRQQRCIEVTKQPNHIMKKLEKERHAGTISLASAKNDASAAPTAWAHRIGAPLFPRERKRAIARLIEEQGSVRVDELAERFSISVDSIRKDLKSLADEGLCRREYGGAVRVSPPGAAHDASAAPTDAVQEAPSPTTTQQDARRENSRRTIAARAYMEIADGDAVFLDVSRTSLYIAELLARGDKRCIVTTNMMDISTVLAKNPKVTALITGGYLTPDMRGFTGPTTISLLEPLLFEKAFIACSGVNVANRAVMTDLMDDGMVKQRAIENATYRFLLAEDWKFSVRSGYRFSSTTDFTGVITDCADTETLRAISSDGVATLC